jgi:hypothetical protein
LNLKASRRGQVLNLKTIRRVQLLGLENKPLRTSVEPEN